MENIKQITYDKLKELGISYDVYDHEPLYTIEAAAELDKKIGFPICKNLFLSTKHQTEFYLLFMMGEKKFRTGSVSKQVGVPRMTFGDDGHMWEYLKIRPGAVSPLGLLYDTEHHVNFLIDSDVLNMEKISIHPCDNTSTIVIQTKDLLEKILPACGHAYRVVTVE
ncbi:MAG: prolyl-tRNA synthetase associated domain-containing protein [Epulopiscium sp.]|nr:prolyl-tRNA synthetase associated domain-containing protein [Candidatus Epulonipiscium sp.]